MGSGGYESYRRLRQPCKVRDLWNMGEFRVIFDLAQSSELWNAEELLEASVKRNARLDER